jgi:3-methyladenine DNA glycosylase AlkD
MTAKEIVEEIKPLGSDSYKRVIFNHGVKEPCFGVKVGDLQKIVKRNRGDYQLALDLYDTGIYDAMYLGGLIADDARMTKKDLQHWVAKAYCRPLCGSTVAWVAAGSAHGWELGLEWIDSKTPLVAVAGWATLGSLVSIKDDTQLDLAALKRLLQQVQETIHQAQDVVRYQMNSFVIAVGSYVQPLTDTAMQTAEKIGPVMADLGNNSCQVPFAPDHIRKVQKRGTIGRNARRRNAERLVCLINGPTRALQRTPLGASVPSLRFYNAGFAIQRRYPGGR